MNKHPPRPLALFPLALLLLLPACNGSEKKTSPMENPFLLPNALVAESDPIPFPPKTDHVRLLVFIHPDDPICLNALRTDFAAIQTDYAPRGLALIALIPTVQTHPPVLEDLNALHLPFPIAYAEPPMIEALGGDAAIRAIPTSFLYDASSPTPARSYAGYPNIPLLRADIEALLNHQPLPPPAPLFLPEENPA